MKLSIYPFIEQGLANLIAAKLRSFLAVLGVLVGTAAIVALISCGQLATEKALLEFKSLGTNLVVISLFQPTRHEQKLGPNFLSLKQWQNVLKPIPAIAEIAPYATAYQAISIDGHSLQGSIVAADERLASALHLEMLQGHFVSFVESFEHYCVIGDGLAKKIKAYSLDSPLGKQLLVGNTLYTVIGVLKHWKENGFINEDLNEAIIVPIKGLALVSRDAKINNAIVLLKPDTPIEPVVQKIKDNIIEAAPKVSVFVRSAKQLIESMENQGHIFTLLLAVIGSISLIVGGIGVMNVMLGSVSERKKEIGIRKAIGAKNSDIQILFLVESVMLTLLGGVLGVIVGIILTIIVAYFSGWPFTLHFLPPSIGFLVSVATGIFFGFYPARRASHLLPVESLRS